MSTIADQPAPIATDRRPSWEIVTSYVEQNASPSLGVVALVLSDMRARDAVGRQHYGTPLTSGNGRDHLVDAYQELLDGCVYLATELDEHGVDPSTRLSERCFSDPRLPRHLSCVQQLFATQVRSLIQLRELIEEWGS
jgi:hypothetical protein